MNPEQFTTELQKKGIELSDRQLEQFAIYFQTLVEWNKKINLTALTSEADVYLKHFYDLVAGAGFPSIPLKICFPHLHISIVDSLNKRIGFLNHLADQLELDNVTFYHSRAEDFGKNTKYRETFDVVMARAVARMSVL